MDASLIFDDDDKFKEQVTHYANVIKEDKDELLRMLESMGHILTHRDYERRAAGVKLVSEVIGALPKRFLSRDETDVVLHFFVRKLEDHPLMVPPCINGLYELTVNDHDLGDSEVEKIIQAILFDVPLPALLQAERYAVYRMLAYMLLNHKSSLCRMGSQFLNGCIQAIEGERDPRCLLQMFAIIPMICKNFILGELEQTLFEVCACYFPIDFNPPPNDTGKISREDLADALLWCMTASAGFGKYCIPLAVEKLGSDLTVAKLDSLKLLIHGADVFPAACFINKAVLIWKQIYSLVFVNRHEVIIPTALNCLSSVSRAISKQKHVLTILFKTIWKDLQQGEVPGMGKVLEAFSRASAEACSVALVVALPRIIQLLSQNEGLRPILVLESTTTVLSLYAALCNHQKAAQELNQLLRLLADLLCTLLTGNDDELTLRAVTALRTVLPIKDFLTASQLKMVEGLLLHLATCRDAPAPRNEHILLLATAARTACLSEEIWYTIKQEIEKGYHPVKTERILKMATACAGSPVSLSILLPIIEEHFLSAIRDLQIDYRNQLAKCLSGIVFQAEQYKVSFQHTSLLKKILSAWMLIVHCGHTNECSESFAEVAGLLQKLSKVCNSSDMKDIIVLIQEACIETSFANSSLLLLRSVVCHVRPEALCTNQNFVQLLILFHCEGTSEHVPQCLAAFVNKLPDANLEETLNCVCVWLKPEWTVAKTELLLWVIKALLLRGYPDLVPYTTLLKELLRDERLGRHVAEGFQQILRPSVLTTEGHCVIKLMHPQRFFVETVDFLIEGFNSATTEAVKENFLMGLCCQLSYVPKQVVNTYIDQILPILVTALSSTEEPVLGDCVLPCLTENVGLMVSCLDSVLVQLLRLAKPPFFMKVRWSALRCLQRIATTEDDKLLPYRQQVVQGLTQCLADRKRIVRQTAGQASSMWHMVGEPKGVQQQLLL
uniref:MMS19 nucleotide excision repair protein n=1 Tax=Hyalomma excavatum TaxID=257692 RepID=A0A131XHH9_9ACAR